MLISRASAGHFMADTGNTGGGDTLLIILGAGIVLGLLYVVQKKWRQRHLARHSDHDSQQRKTGSEEASASPVARAEKLDGPSS